MTDAFSTLQKHIIDLQEETLEYYSNLANSESYEERVYDSKMINDTIETK